VAGPAGGRVSDGGNVTLVIPPGALAGDTQFSFTELPSIPGLPSGLTLIPGSVARIDWTGAGFVADAAITLLITPTMPTFDDGGAFAASGSPQSGAAVYTCPGGGVPFVYPQTAPSGTGATQTKRVHVGCLTVDGGTGGGGSATVGLVQPSTSTYPIVTQDPIDVTRAAAASASFAGAAANNPTYQWRRDGVDIPGATSPGYTIASAAPTDSGARFAFVANNAYGSVWSAAAVLTVQGCVGACACSATQLECSGSCANPRDNRDNCGACGQSCGWGCAEGACVSPTGPALGGGHTCVVDPSQRVLCWGINNGGELGDGTIVNRSHPVFVQGAFDVVQVATGSEHTCAVTSAGEVLCWGANGYGEMGDGEATADHLVPTAVPGLTDVVQISGGGAHTCALRASGDVACWGYNVDGELGPGNGAPNPSYSPVFVAGLNDAVEVSAGGAHTCARRRSGEVVCWGDNTSGQLGVSAGTASGQIYATGVDDAVEISAGRLHSCARRVSGEVTCWGTMRYSTGTPTPMGPTTIAGIEDAVEINASSGFIVDILTTGTNVPMPLSWSCARRQSGQVVCWGAGVQGVLGDGSSMDQMLPVPVMGLTDAAEIGHGCMAAHNCARRSSGELVCWGFNAYGQLGNGEGGDGKVRSNATPVAVLPQ
jgi:alpha-tubulin suppressor-like RCC1 family protein